MVNRVDLIRAVSPSVKLPTKDGVAYQKALTKSLIILLANYDLEDARNLNKAEKKELATSIDQLFTLAELKRISKKWEPNRSVSSGFTQSEIVHALHTLLFEEREPYIRPKLKLNEAQALKGREYQALGAQIEKYMPLAELKKVLTLWDKKFKPPKSWSVRQYRERVLGLFVGKVEPE